MKMNINVKNLDSPNTLTEFGPISPEGSPSAISSFLNKFFGFSSSTNQEPTVTTNKSEDKDSSSLKNDQKSSDKTPESDNVSVSSFSVDANEGRSLPNVLKRISNIVASKSNNLQSYKDSELRSYWMPDNVSKQCYECAERFTTFRRRHHCRVCGQIFCSKCCCDVVPGKIMGCTGDLRVCTYCSKVVLSYLQSSDVRSDLSADLRALQEDLEEKYGNSSAQDFKQCTKESSENYIHRRKPSVGYMEEKYAFGRTRSYLSPQERIFALQNSASLRMLYEELFRSEHSIPLQTHRIRLNRYFNCFTGLELVNWLIDQNKAATRIQGSAIGQALFEANFIEPVLQENEFSDSSALFRPAKIIDVQSRDFLIDSKISSCDAQEPAWVKNIPQSDSTTDSENECKQPIQTTGRLASSDSSFYLDLNFESSTVMLKRPVTEDMIQTNNNSESIEHKEVNVIAQEIYSKDSDDLLNDVLQVQDIKGRDGWHKATNLKTAFEESHTYHCVTLAYKQHQDMLLKQLLNKEGLSQNWTKVILQISDQVIEQVRPDLSHDNDDLDIRQYVQIKKSTGGSKNDCEILSGVVCNKNIAHKNMNAMIANPKILLLRCGLMYQRVEGKLLTLEPVMLQESEFLGHTVAKITALGPDIVIVHKSVSRLAQDKLRECGVTLVLNVKLSILDRLARCTNASIVDSIDAHISARYKLGTCKKFYLRTFPCEKQGIKTLMYFEDCANAHLGTTVLLRGASENELRKVKRVVSTMIFATYSSRLEKSFLMDEFAKPPMPNDNSFFDESFVGRSAISKETCDKSDTCGDNTLTHKALFDSNVENNDVYNTLKLFKTRSSFDDSEIKTKNLCEIENAHLDCSKNNEEEKCGSAIQLCDNSTSSNVQLQKKDDKTSDEKRAIGESICDKSDPLHQYLNEDSDDIVSNTVNLNDHYLNAEIPLLNKFKTALEGNILSISPFLKFSIPYLETETGRNCVLRNFFPKEVYYSACFLDKVEGTKNSVTQTETHSMENFSKTYHLKLKHAFINKELTSGVDSKEVQGLIANFRACGGFNFQNNTALTQQNYVANSNEYVDQTTAIWPDCLDPASHQRLSVLFCSFFYNNDSTNAAFCVNPWIINMDFYGRNDIPLGRFLERYCLTKDYKCPSQKCRAQVAQHVRRFVHDFGCVYISLCQMSSEPFNQEDSQKIYMWNKCTKCKSVSPVVPISKDTWSLSFGKYLELRFHGGAYTRRGADTCSHSLHHDHQQYFSKENMVAVIRYTKTSQWEISLPPPTVNIFYNNRQYSNVMEEIKNIALKGDEVFTCIKEKLLDLQIDADTMNLLKQSLSKDQQYFKTKIEEVQIKLTSPALNNFNNNEKDALIMIYRIEDGIALIKRLISETVSNNNNKINELAAKKKDEKPKKVTAEKVNTQIQANVIENDDYITEDTVTTTNIKDLSPISADNNVIEAIQSNQSNLIASENNETVDTEFLDSSNNIATEDADIVPNLSKPQSSHANSQILQISSDDGADKKKKKKTILSQLLPSTPSTVSIQSPFPVSEHHLLPLGTVVPIVVYETEPSSIIAYALNSHDYRHALQDPQRFSKDHNASPVVKRKLQDNKESALEILQSLPETKKPSVLSFLRTNSSSLASPGDVDKSQQSSDVTTVSGPNIEVEDDKKNLKQQNYVEVQFSDATADFYCRIYFASQFAALRENILPCGEDGFVRSLTRSVPWAARGGKSGSTFSKTKDERFILKGMNGPDTQIFLEFVSNYFSYMEKCQQTKQPTLLAKILGVYRISYKNNSTNSGLKMNVLVMENLFYNRAITAKFDLKGSMRNRLADIDNIDNEGELVLLDENLLNMSCDSPLYIRPHAKAVLNKAIEEDTKFLADICVMDYSLLVGLEPSSDELVLGIIDYLRTFTWDKKLENIVKKSGILGGQGKQPTIVSPVEYRVRFIDAMHKYFLPAPDRWTGLSRGVTVAL